MARFVRAVTVVSPVGASMRNVLRPYRMDPVVHRATLVSPGGATMGTAPLVALWDPPA